MGELKFIAPEQMARAVGPVTKLELDHIQASRQKAVPTLELTPGGTVERSVHEFEQRRLAQREAYIANRLERLKGRASNDLSLAKMRGRAKRDFGWER